MKKIIFFKGKLETLDFFVDKLCVGAQQLGIEYYVANAKDEKSYTGEAFRDFIQNGNVAVFMINQIGLKLMENGENFWEKHNIEIYDLIVDHPYNFDDALDHPLKNLHVFVLDWDHELFIRKYYPEIQHIFFMPNGGWEVESMIPFSNREFDVFYAGGCSRRHPYVKIPYFEDGGAQFYQVCIQSAIENPNMTIESIIEIYCEQVERMSYEQKKDIILNYAYIIMHNVRRYFKLSCMHAIERTGARIEIYGGGWLDDGEAWASNVHIHEWVTSEECNRLSGHAKIGLNFMPWYKNGCSERVFNIMLNKSVCMTDVSGYLLERFEQGREVVYFNLDDPEGLAANVKFLLENPNIAERIASRGYSVASQNDTWVHRFQYINSIINA